MIRRLAEQLQLDPDSLGGISLADSDVMAHLNLDAKEEDVD